MYLTNTHLSGDIEAAVQLFYKRTIAHDKGKPAVRQGRKAVSLPQPFAPRDCLVAEGDRRWPSPLLSFWHETGRSGPAPGPRALGNSGAIVGPNSSDIPFFLVSATIQHSTLRRLVVSTSEAELRPGRASRAANGSRPPQLALPTPSGSSGFTR